MSVEKERLSSTPFLPDWIWKEHNARFVFATSFCKDRDVLDCACGSGVGTLRFATTALSLKAIDISQEALDEAKNRLQHNTTVVFIQGSATQIPLPDTSVDVYISLETIEHLKDDRLYLKEAYRVLRKGGTFICSTPNRTVTNPGKTLIDKPANPFHIREYSATEFTELLQKDFSSVSLFAQNPLSTIITIPLGFLGKLLPSHTSTRIHQAIKLIASFFRNDLYYSIRPAENKVHYEYVVAVCIKK